MSAQPKSTDERKSAAQLAEQSAAQWLYLGNRASERGQPELADRHYQRAQKWHDRMNDLLGNGSGNGTEVGR